ncbi:glycoside hydrolase family 2 TIM barrel-domain containing protein [Flavobacterium daejeonense]|uniref:glycoside hydrolase family 2 TIM barrel-domain containing protein n=1 Tax=Flavobacterium daejeonense TaxID=350893 RepID=UPI00047BF062|nr:glycoside hydrolase family 2 TIM barrel-domain containing protein [Flavobacterium daejeonense]
MKLTITIKHILFSVLCVALLFPAYSQKKQQVDISRKVLFDNDWHFYKGSVKNAQDPSFNDSAWRLLDLPHDWSIEPMPNQKKDSVVGPFSRASVGGFATGQTVGGEGWYRKTFVISPKNKGQRHELYFEGVYNQAEVWVNGQKVGQNVYGYSSFRFDITPFCNPAGQQNVVAVKVLNEGKNSRWYSGSGIYRHVWLLQTPQTYIEDWGTFITTKKIANNQAEVALSTTIVEGNAKNDDFTVITTIVAADGKNVGQESQKIKINSKAKKEVPFIITIKNPSLWSIEKPNLYEAKIALWEGKTKIDELAIPFGIRTIEFSVIEGFKLNGVKTLLKGGCVHHDNGLLGSAAFNRAEERKIELLKKSGFNAIRTSHNPMSESFLDACDRLGMLVINEAFDQWKKKKNANDYHQYFEEWSAKDIRSLVLRDRNHPSVIMWSLGNEIPERITDAGSETALYLKNEILKYDTTRPITAGVNKHWDKEHKNMLPLDNALKHLDISGYNYMWRFYEEEHAKTPDKVMFSSESVATEASENWDKVEKLPYVIGDFIWTAMDYLGESGLGNSFEVDPQENVHQFMGWPWYNGWCGDIDLIGVKKPQSYYRDILWREKKISMAVELPVAEGKIKKVSFWGWPEESLSWTFPNMENKELNVNVYSRAPKVRLYLNDQLIGEKETNAQYKTGFKVPYKPGTLKAVELVDGKEGASTLLQTVGTAAAIKLKADRATIKADGQDLSYVLIELTDQNGNTILDANQQVVISSKGAGKIIGSGNGAPTDMASFGSLQPSLFKGRAMVIIRAGKEAGKTELIVTSNGVPTATIVINSL